MAGHLLCEGKVFSVPLGFYCHHLNYLLASLSLQVREMALAKLFSLSFYLILPNYSLFTHLFDLVVSSLKSQKVWRENNKSLPLTLPPTVLMFSPKAGHVAVFFCILLLCDVFIELIIKGFPHPADVAHSKRSKPVQTEFSKGGCCPEFSCSGCWTLILDAGWTSPGQGIYRAISDIL